MRGVHTLLDLMGVAGLLIAVTGRMPLLGQTCQIPLQFFLTLTQIVQYDDEKVIESSTELSLQYPSLGLGLSR